jgi:glutamate synthase (NADPH/NADH) small chain
MNQIELRELENRCIQEEVPACTARCPIHVDVRSFLKKAAQGEWDEAFHILAVTMPLPGIVGRICDHPCEPVCRRAEAGDAVSISNLERTTVTRSRVTKRQDPLPRKDHCVAIVGSSLSSLVASWDLARKGYRVSIFEEEDRLGKSLWEISEDILPREIIAEEIGVLKLLGVETRPALSMRDQGWLDAIIAEFDAIYVGLDSESLSDPGGLPEICIPANPVTLATSRAGLFVGGGDIRRGFFPFIESVAEGRKAATSIDRLLQRVSLTAGREHEGSYETRLFTSLAGVAPQPGIPMEHPSGYSETEAREEAGRCIQCECMECVKACLYLERFKSYPKRYIRQIYNNEAILIGSHGQTNRLINSCGLCGLCEVLCPNDLSMATVCMEGRVSLVNRGKMPPSAHDFALEDMKYSNSDKSALALPEPGKDRCAFIFFPGCQLGALYPDHVISSYAYLRRTLKGGVALMVRCCGAPARWAGRRDLFEGAFADLTADWEKLGRATMVVACPTCYQTLKQHLPRADLTTLWQVIADSAEGETGVPVGRVVAPPGEGAIPSPSGHTRAPLSGSRSERSCPSGTFALHDPCTTRYEPAMQQSVRRILTRLGNGVEELDLSRDKTECCGFGGLMSFSNPSLARDVAKRRSLRSDTDYVTYCATCRNALASTGKRILHILDLLFGSKPDPAGLGPLGLSERHENRYRLKQRLLAELWAEELPMEDYERIVLYVSPEVRRRMEERRILPDDVQKTINHAEKSGMEFFNAALGRFLASFRPAHVTYWVEYSCEGGASSPMGYRIHNAYSHRMEVMGDRRT